jgi:hypothetical protein
MKQDKCSFITYFGLKRYECQRQKDHLGLHSSTHRTNYDDDDDDKVKIIAIQWGRVNKK